MNENANNNNDLQDLVNTKLANAKPIDYTAAAVNDTPPEQTSLSGIAPPEKIDFIPMSTTLYEDVQAIMATPKSLEIGFSMLDTFTGGIDNGLTVIGGESGTGKTALACQIAYNLGLKGVKCVFLSLELPHKRIKERIHAIYAKIPYKIHKDPIFYGENIAPLQPENKAMQNIQIIDFIGKSRSPASVYGYIKNITNAIRNKYGEEQDIVFFIDYLQHIDSDSGGDSGEYRAITSFCRWLENESMEKSLKIIVLSQLNRQASKDIKENGIQSEHFLGSGKIAHSANILIGLTKNPNKTGEKRINICKNRYGEEFNGFIFCDFNGIWFDETTISEKTSDLITNSDNNEKRGDKW